MITSAHSYSPTKPNYVTILAIYDDPPSQPSKNIVINGVESSQPNASTLSIPIPVRVNAAPYIEVENLETPPTNGLQVLDGNVQERTSIRCSKVQNPQQIKKISGEIQHSVHFSTQSTDDSLADWRKHNARKSRISNTFLEAKNRIEQNLLENEHWAISFDSTKYRFQRIVLSAETQDCPMGLEIFAVPNPERPSHLLAVEVRTIEQQGRLAEDGHQRLRVGDQIVEINGMPCDQISFARARLYLRELQNVPEPSLAFFRRIYPEKRAELLANSQKLEQPLNALQRGNTSRIGQCTEVRLTKETDGFGFSYAGRLNAREEHLYYVKGLRRDHGLSVGDRILKIDGVDLTALNQSEVTALLKSKPVGTTVTLLVSRTEEQDGTKQITFAENEAEKENDADEVEVRMESSTESLESELARKLEKQQELLRLEIPLNETPGAGLGISVKAQRMGSTDRGLYVRSILHGSAAYKDGRLRVNDRLVGVEDENLRQYSLNGEALDAFMRTLAQLPKGKGVVRIYVARKTSAQQGGEPDDDELMSRSEEFVRDSASRRSISEKRPFGQHNDPAHLRTYQRIVHQRQTSAPALSSRSRRSMHEPAALVNGPRQKPAENQTNNKSRRPKSTFYVTEDQHMVLSRTLPSPKSRPTNCDPSPSSCSPTERESLTGSRSQPESIAFLTRSETVAAQGGANTVKAPAGKRRSSLGSGLFKLFGRNQSNKEEHRHEHPHPQGWRPPPPPYRPPNWPQPQCHAYQTEQSSTNHLAQLAPNTSQCPNSFRLWPTHFPGHGLDEALHWRPDADNSVSSRCRQPPWTTTTNHSTSGSQFRPAPAAYSTADHHHPLPWQLPFLPGKKPPTLGKVQPSAIFYDQHDPQWVIRC